MNKHKNIVNKNPKGQFHGYQEWHNSTGKLRLRSIAKNGKSINYQEWHDNKRTTFYIT